MYLGDEPDLAALYEMDYTEPESSVKELLERAVAAGHGEHSISSLVEVLRKPAQFEA